MNEKGGLASAYRPPASASSPALSHVLDACSFSLAWATRLSIHYESSFPSKFVIANPLRTRFAKRFCVG